jgi:hypothetical protein
MKKEKKYKFNIESLLPIGITIVITGLVLAFGLQVMGETKTDMGDSACAGRSDGYTTFVEATNLCTNGSDTLAPSTSAWNATGDGIEGVGKLTEKLPLIATVVIAVVIIGILVTYFARS